MIHDSQPKSHLGVQTRFFCCNFLFRRLAEQHPRSIDLREVKVTT